MSRPAPDYLTKEDVRAVADVRRDIWSAGFTGLLYGTISGYILHTFAKFFHNRMSDAAKLKLHAPGDAPMKFSRNTAFLSVMIGGAVGSFAMATATGKNQVHNLHDIYEKGKQAKEDEERERYRVNRRKTIQKTLEEGHGLSDSHGGHWVDEAEPRR